MAAREIDMSLHETLLNERFWGINVFSAFGLLVTLGIMMSCICRINAMRPRPWRITLEACMYLLFAAWAMEAFMDLVFLQMFSGYDIAIGAGIMLHLHSTYKHWEGDDCVCDVLNFWRLERRQRIADIHNGIKHGRRKADKH
jgi:hypothetical protein